MKLFILSLALMVWAIGCSGAAGAQPLTQLQSDPLSRTVTWDRYGISFTVPKDWRKDDLDEDNEMTWKSPNPNHSKFGISVAIYKSNYGDRSIQEETEKYFADQKNSGSEDLRYLEIDAVRGVHYLRDDDGFDENLRVRREKTIIWNAQRMYKAERQIVFTYIVSPASNFAKDRESLYRILQSLKFSR